MKFALALWLSRFYLSLTKLEPGLFWIIQEILLLWVPVRHTLAAHP